MNRAPRTETAGPSCRRQAGPGTPLTVRGRRGAGGHNPPAVIRTSKLSQKEYLLSHDDFLKQDTVYVGAMPR